MRFTDAGLHARGEALFVDDLEAPEGLLHAAVLASPVARGRLARLDTQPALALPGVCAVLTFEDIPGENQIGNILQDEVLLASSGVNYVGETIAVVIAATAASARRAIQAIALEIEPLPPVFDARVAYEQGMLIAPPRTFCIGDVESAWAQCDQIVTGRAESGAQEHAYLETQAALAIPGENGALKVFSSTQSPTLTQRMIARVLGCPMHQVEVDVPRLGGGFGGKEEQATRWAVLASLAAHRLQRPVKLVLRRGEDLRMTGKRHPYSASFKLGLKDGQFLAYAVQFYQNAGATADLSPAILARTLFHATNSYYIPNVQATAVSCRTHLPPYTACRGFGAPQAMFVMEAAIYQAALKLGVDPAVLQEKNLLQEGDVFPYGMAVRRCRARRCWRTTRKHYAIAARRKAVARFNATHALEKKGLAVMPICFGVSFTTTFLNQASALVHVYTDGSVGVSSGAVEMGQGVKTKIQQVVARMFGLQSQRVKVESTNTTRIANMSPTAASTGADMNGHAARLACLSILERLKAYAAKHLNCQGTISFDQGRVYVDAQPTELTWDQLVNLTYLDRVSLSAQAHYATPGIYFDRSQEKGQPFAYHVFGAALVEATLDCLLGSYRIDSVKVVHDVGESLNPLIDRGQVEGGVVQGVGWMTLEEILHDGQGRLLSNTLTTYKIPDIYCAPEVETLFLENADHPLGIFHSKAIGEPPLMYGIGAYFALLGAMRAFRSDVPIRFSAPLTPEKVLMDLEAGKG